MSAIARPIEIARDRSGRGFALVQSLIGFAAIIGVLQASRASESIDLMRFPLAWIGVLVCLDGLVRLRRGRSPLAAPADWLWTLFASVVFWDLFELVNLRLQDWWYTGESQNPLESMLFSAASFATVLPAVRLLQALTESRATAPRAALRDPARSIKRRSPALLAAIGVAALALAMAFPQSCFPLAWLFVWPLCEALIASSGPRESGALASPLESWREGDRRPVYRLLLCGIPLGLVWEALNWGCARGWVYTVPHFESHKLFEMPLAGFLGYPPFLLEAASVLAVTDRIRRAVHRNALSRAVAPFVFAALVIGVHFGCDALARPRTAISFAGRLGDADSLKPIAPLLEKAFHARTPRALLDTAARASDLRAMALDAGLRVSDLPGLLYALRESALAERTGMGLGWADSLMRAGIDSLEVLARTDAGAVFDKLSLQRGADHLPLPNAMLVRLWIARARATVR